MGFIKAIEEISERHLRTYEFYDAEMLTIFFETKIEVMEQLIPPPLTPTTEAIGLIIVANYPRTNFNLSYLESALFLTAKYKDEEGFYCLAMPVSDDMAMIGGRETFGYPKKIGEIFFERQGDNVRGWTERRGKRFLDVKVKLTGKFNDENTQKYIMQQFKSKFEICVYNFKYFPSPNLVGFDYNPRLIKETVEFNPKTIQIGEAELELNSSDHDPWGDIDVVTVLGAVYTIGDNTMLPGRVVAEVDQKDFLPYSLMKIDT